MQRLFLIIALLLSPVAATAQGQQNELAFRFGLGPKFEPGYFGDEDTDVGLAVKFRLDGARLAGRTFGGDKSYGLGFGGSLRFLNPRDADDFDEFAGLDDIDAALELGAGPVFSAPNYQVFAKLRYGVIGHGAWVGVVGADLVVRPSDALTLKAGPRIHYGDDTFAQTYFGISAAEASGSSFDAFDASGGMISTGLKAEATYAINDTWGIIGTLEFDQLMNDAADSPITQSDDQLGGSIVLTRSFKVRF